MALTPGITDGNFYDWMRRGCMTVDDLRKEILAHREYMRERELSHDQYFVDPNGRQKDMEHLQYLKSLLQIELKKEMEIERGMLP